MVDVPRHTHGRGKGGYCRDFATALVSSQLADLEVLGTLTKRMHRVGMLLCAGVEVSLYPAVGMAESGVLRRGMRASQQPGGLPSSAKDKVVQLQGMVPQAPTRVTRPKVCRTAWQAGWRHLIFPLVDPLQIPTHVRPLYRNVRMVRCLDGSRPRRAAAAPPRRHSASLVRDDATGQKVTILSTGCRSHPIQGDSVRVLLEFITTHMFPLGCIGTAFPALLSMAHRHHTRATEGRGTKLRCYPQSAPWLHTIEL